MFRLFFVSLLVILSFNGCKELVETEENHTETNNYRVCHGNIGVSETPEQRCARCPWTCQK